MADTDSQKSIVSAVTNVLFRLDNPAAPTEGKPTEEEVAKAREDYKAAFKASKKEYAKKANKFVRQLEARGIVLTVKEDA